MIVANLLYFQRLFEPTDEELVIKEEIGETMLADGSPTDVTEGDPLIEVDRFHSLTQAHDSASSNTEKSKNKMFKMGKLREMVLACTRKEGAVTYCAIDDGKDCSHFQTLFNQTNFARHFRLRHREKAECLGFFVGHEKELQALQDPKDKKRVRHRIKFIHQSGYQRNLNDMLDECVCEGPNGTYCRINSNSECTYRQQVYNPHNFARHFRAMHPEEAGEKGFFKLLVSYTNKNESHGSHLTKKTLLQRDLIEKYTVETAEGVQCRIAGPCPYVQKKFMATNFERHFRSLHPKEAMEKGFNKVQDEVLTRVREYDKLWKECVAVDEYGAYCRLAQDCPFSQKTFAKAIFRRHFFQMHNEEATRKGFTKEQARDSSSTSTELTKTIEKFVVRHENGVFCRISESHCSFRRGAFEPSNFLRHFLDEHPEEATANGLTLDRSEPKTKAVETQMGNRTFQRMVFECTESNDSGIHCRIDGTRNCRYSQTTFHLMDYLRHFRTGHTAEATAKRFFRSQAEKRPRMGVRAKVIMKHIKRKEGELRCGIGTNPCSFTRDKFSLHAFARHFCIKHQEEAEEHGFFAEINRPSVSSDPQLEDLEDLPSVESVGLAVNLDTEAVDDPLDEPFGVYEDHVVESSSEEADNDHDLQLDTPSEDPATYCRLCFSIAQPLRLIFDGTSALANQIITCAGIGLNAETDSSSSICFECVQKLDDIQGFRQLCQTLDKVVREKLPVKNQTPNEVDSLIKLEITNFQQESTLDAPVMEPFPANDGCQTANMEEDDEHYSSDTSIELNNDQPAQALTHHDQINTYDCRPAVFIRTKHFRCGNCGAVMATKAELACHRQMHHKEREPPDEQFHCTMSNCNFHITDAAQLEQISILKHS